MKTHFDHNTTDLHLRWGESAEANLLVMTHHYSKRIPANVQMVGTFHLAGGLFGDFGAAVAAVFFSIPPTRWSVDVWELSRLVRDDACTVPLTSLIAHACKRIKQDGLQDLLVSFADSTQGHHGGIYQACSWNYHGKRDKRMDGVVIDGVFVPGRSCNSIYGTQSPDKLRQMMPHKDIQPHYDEGKHLYWRAINRRGERKAKEVGLSREPYPKPDAADCAKLSP